MTLQVDAVEGLEAYAYGRRDEAGNETVNLLRSINRNPFCIFNILQTASGGEVFRGEGGKEEVEVDVFGEMAKPRSGMNFSPQEKAQRAQQNCQCLLTAQEVWRLFTSK